MNLKCYAVYDYTELIWCFDNEQDAISAMNDDQNNRSIKEITIEYFSKWERECSFNSFEGYMD